MNPDWFEKDINRVAETHFVFRPVLEQALKSHIITPEGRAFMGRDFKNYHEMWLGTFADRFYDMGAFIRFGSAIEHILRNYYMERKDYKNLLKLQSDPKYKQGVFQRLMPWTHTGVIELYRAELGYDLATNKHLPIIQEGMLHRHLYAHNAGLLDDKYIDDVKRLTGTDLLQADGVKGHYPANDVYWFEPLERLNDFVNYSRKFFREFPL